MVPAVGNPNLSDRHMAGNETLLRLIAQRDPDAAAGFFDAHAPSVRRYCEELAAPERLDEATLAAFVDLLGRVESAPRGPSSRSC